MRQGSERHSEHPVERFFLERWSPRAFRDEAIPKADLLTMVEAARWAPSAYNHQPWRFFYARRGDVHWQGFVDLLDTFNAEWAQNASALILVASDTLIGAPDDEAPAPSRSHSFDTGAACSQLAIQATHLGYHVHVMAGVDFERAHQHLKLPARFRVEVAIAVGRHGDPRQLPEALASRELPSQRLPLDQIAFAGSFPG
nr:nitroreductase family protein [Bosea sp. BIWAKO-01]